VFIRLRINVFSVRKLDQPSARRLLALFCVVVVALLLVAEAVHAHPAVDAGKLRAPGSHCAICAVAQGAAPAAVVALPTAAVPVHLMAPAASVARPSHDRIIQLFVRPPPAA
jgi:hypothetical protein